MSEITPLEAQKVIIATFNECLNFLRFCKNTTSPDALKLAKDLPELERILGRGESFRKELFEGLAHEGYIYLLNMSYDLAEIYELSTRSDVGSLLSRVRQGQQVKTKVRYLQNCDPPASIWQPGEKTVKEKLISQVKKFRDEKLAERILALENGQSRMVFMEMKDGMEGQTVFNNGKITYRLNKKYEKASEETDLWRASIILAHELQRNPETGDLRGETADIVLRDMAFVEKLETEYGEKVYENMPEFAILRAIKELCGEEMLREFADKAFNHEGSYYNTAQAYFDMFIRPRWLLSPPGGLEEIQEFFRKFLGGQRRTRMNPQERDFVREVLGQRGERALRTSIILQTPGGIFEPILNDRGASLPLPIPTHPMPMHPVNVVNTVARRLALRPGVIFLGSEDFKDPMARDEGRNLLIHEVFHQLQYSGLLPSSLVFARLGGEQIFYELGVNVYDFGDLATITRLEDIRSREARAQLVGDFAELYYNANHNGRYRSNSPNDVRARERLIKMATILINSGFDTKATQWVTGYFLQLF